MFAVLEKAVPCVADLFPVFGQAAEMPKLSFGDRQDQIHQGHGMTAGDYTPPLGMLSFRQRPRIYSPAGQIERKEHPKFGAAAWITPCIVPVFKPEQGPQARLKELCKARKLFKEVCAEIGAPGWGMPDLFRVFVFDHDADPFVQYGVWWGAYRTVGDGDRMWTGKRAIRREATATDPNPLFSEEQGKGREVRVDMQKRAREFEAAVEASLQAEATAEPDAPTSVTWDDAEKAQDMWPHCHIEMLHPTPFAPNTADLNGMVLIVEALRRVTAACDLEIFAMGLGELPFGMIRLRGGKSYLAPVKWPMEGAQTSCMVPLQYDTLGFLAANPWVVETVAPFCGLDTDLGKGLAVNEAANLLVNAGDWMETHRDRLRMALGTKTVSRNPSAQVWSHASGVGTQWDTDLQGSFPHLLAEDRAKHMEPQSVLDWEHYWVVRDRLADILKTMIRMEEQSPAYDPKQPTMGRTPETKVVLYGKKGLQEALTVVGKASGSDAYEDEKELFLQSKVLADYADRMLLWNARKLNLDKCAVANPVGLTVAVLVLQGEALPEFPVEKWFPRLQGAIAKPLSKIRLREQGRGKEILTKGLKEKAWPLHVSDDGLFFYLGFGSENYGASGPFTNFFQAVTRDGLRPIPDPRLVDVVPMEERIQAQKAFDPASGIAPMGQWKMLSKTPFVGIY